MKNKQKEWVIADGQMKDLVKSVYKSVLNSMKQKKDAQKVVEDILDPNYTAEVDPDSIPPKKDAVLYKGKDQCPKEAVKVKKKPMKKMNDPTASVLKELKRAESTGKVIDFESRRKAKQDKPSPQSGSGDTQSVRVQRMRNTLGEIKNLMAEQEMQAKQNKPKMDKTEKKPNKSKGIDKLKKYVDKKCQKDKVVSLKKQSMGPPPSTSPPSEDDFVPATPPTQIIGTN